MSVSDVLDVVRRIRKTKLDRHALGGDDSVEAIAAEAYVKELRSGNLADPFDVTKAVRDAAADPDTGLASYVKSLGTAIVLGSLTAPCPVDVDLIEAVFGAASVRRLVVESPLNSSLTPSGKGECGVAVEAFDPRDWSQASQDESVSSSPSATEDYCVKFAEGCLRLLLNSRDEIALGRIICGPSGILDRKAFNIIKREGAKTNMPLYQVGNVCKQ